MPMNLPDRPRASQGDYQVLDPSLLGRPVHLLPKFARRFADVLGTTMGGPGGRRYWGAYRLSSLAFERAPEEANLRWLSVEGPLGTAAVAFERSLLLGLLEGRYGRKNAPQGATAGTARDTSAERVTATEERLAATLTAQLAEQLHACIADALADAGTAGLEAVSSVDPLTLGAPAAASAPGKAGWVIRVVLRAAHGQADSHCWIGLDQELMAHVLQGLMDERSSVRTARSSEPLSSGLFVKLDGRLASKEITLAALFELQVGDVIPVSVGRADVLLDESRLFTAAVAEHKGKLCLTSFEDAE